jgi:hypothetical protein
MEEQQLQLIKQAAYEDGFKQAILGLAPKGIPIMRHLSKLTNFLNPSAKKRAAGDVLEGLGFNMTRRWGGGRWGASAGKGLSFKKPAELPSSVRRAFQDAGMDTSTAGMRGWHMQGTPQLSRKELGGMVDAFKNFGKAESFQRKAQIGQGLVLGGAITAPMAFRRR